ncbi:MAG: LexA family protein [Candidatus Kapaibacteriota bacterium]
MSLKANNILEVKKKFSFVAPILDAKVLGSKKTDSFKNSHKTIDKSIIDSIQTQELFTNFEKDKELGNELKVKNDLLDLNESIDLNQMLAPNSSNLYIVKVAGESMIDVNIYNGDLLIVDKNEKPKDGKIIIAVINGELLVKILKIIDEKVFLFSANSKFLPLEILPNFNFQIQGVVKHVIHEV